MTAPLLILASATIKATAILMLGGLIASLMRRRSAAARHLVWTASLVSVSVVFGLSFVLPAWRVIYVPADILADDATPELIPNAVPSDHPAPAPTVGDKLLRDAVSAAPPATSTRTDATDWSRLILLVWVVGAAGVCCRDVAGRITLHRLGRSSSSHTALSVAALQLAREMGIRRRVHVSCSDDVDLPMTWGVFRPRIVLPVDVTDWSASCRRHVLQHELAHIIRADAATQLMAQVATALFWFHPLVWRAVAHMRTDRERACDDHVLACGVVASDYAADLLNFVARNGLVARQTSALGFAERSKFEQRITALLDPSVTRAVLSPGRMATVAGLVALLAIPLAAMQRAAIDAPRNAQPPLNVSANAPANVQRQNRVVPDAARPIIKNDRRAFTNNPLSKSPSDTTDVFSGCASRMLGAHSSGGMNGDSSSRWTATGGNDGCQYALASAGTVSLNGDVTAIDQISANGYVDLSTDIHGDITQFVARSSASGDITYEFSRNGQRVDDVAARENWVKLFFVCLDRTTAFAIDRRLPVLQRAGGPDNVLAEVERMHSDYAKSVYLTRLIRTTSLDSSSLRRVAQLVARISARHMAGEVIVAVATRQHLTDDARQDFMTLAEKMSEADMRLRVVAALTRAR